MDAGDLIQWLGQVWLVRKVDRELVTAVVESVDRRTEVLASDAESTGVCEVWCRPSRDWPSAPLPLRSHTRLDGVRRATMDLTRLVDWVKLDDFQIGGALYLNPELRLSYGDRLTAIYQDSRNRQTQLSVEIPRHFRPLPSKHPAAVAVAVAAAPKSSTLFRLLKDHE